MSRSPTTTSPASPTRSTSCRATPTSWRTRCNLSTSTPLPPPRARARARLLPPPPPLAGRGRRADLFRHLHGPVDGLTHRNCCLARTLSSAVAIIRSRQRPASISTSQHPSQPLNISGSINEQPLNFVSELSPSPNPQEALRLIHLKHTHFQASTLMHAHPPLQPPRVGESVVGYSPTCSWRYGASSKQNTKETTRQTGPARSARHVSGCSNRSFEKV